MAGETGRPEEAACRVLGRQSASSPTPRCLLKRRLLFFSRAAAIALIFLGLATLSGTVYGWPLVGNWFPGGRSIANSTSLMVAVGGLSLWFWTRRPLRGARTAARIFGGIVFIGAITALLWHPFTLFQSWGVEVSPYAALSLALEGLALVFLGKIFARSIRPAEFLALTAGLLSFVSLLSYAYGSQPDVPPQDNVAMSLPASILILVLSFGIILARPVGLVGSIFADTGVAGTMLRWLAPVLTITPAFMGWLRLFGEWRGWFNAEVGTAIAAGGYVIIFGSMILALGRVLIRTERQRHLAERQLASSEFDARIAFDYAPRGFCLLDEHGRWTRFNDHLCEIFGYSRDEFQKMTYRDIVHPEDLKEAEKLLFQLLENKIKQFSVEIRYVKKDGSIIWGYVTITSLRDVPRSAARAVGVVENVTERKKAQQEIARQKAAAEEANAAKDRLISVISHELRTPLTPVLAAISSYPAGELSEEQDKVIQMMRRNIEHEVCLIDDLLDLTRVTHGKLHLKRVPVDLHALITEVFEEMRPSLTEKGLSSRLLLSAPRHTVQGDPARLRQILLNLLDNAKKFTPYGGYVTVATRAKGNRIFTRVTDSGVGIDSKLLKRIFEAFEQGEQAVQRHFGGLGLGLAISKGLAEAHGGSLHVESPGRGRGATFIIELKLVDQPVIKMPLRQSTQWRGVNVLLVEDHEDTRVTLQRLLERRGHHVVSASSVEGALRLARTETPDVLVSDIGLPDGSGLTLPAAIGKECGRPIPGIALSGFGGKEDIDFSSQAGFTRHLVKPVDIQTLIETIHEVVP